MKRITIIPALAVIALLIFSCPKKEDSKIPLGTITEESGRPAAATSAGTYGYVLRVNAAFYVLESDTGYETDKTKWADSMTLGERVLVGKIRKATFTGDGKAYDFVEVLRDKGKEGLAFASQVAAGGSLAVVIDEKANLYKSAKTIDVTGTILSRKTIVVCLPNTESGGFAEIRAYDPEAQTYRQDQFIRTASISTREADIQSSILLQTALTLKNEGAEKVRKDALLESALLEYPNSAFGADIQALVNPNTAVVIKTEPVTRSFMTVNDNNVNVRDIPDPVAGRIIGQLNRDNEVTVSERTVAASTIDGQSARWYHITEPVNGWVFGVFLE
jgi:hypothetical protein